MSFLCLCLDALYCSSITGYEQPSVSMTLKGDQCQEALVTLILVLLLQGDFRQAKDYVAKLSEALTKTSSSDPPLSPTSLSSYSV